jgi:hypothetical protein
MEVHDDLFSAVAPRYFLKNKKLASRQVHQIKI